MTDDGDRRDGCGADEFRSIIFICEFQRHLNGYNFSAPAWSVPAGTIVGLYAYVGSLPYDASTTIEFFIAYVCDTGTVLTACFGAYGSCPSTVPEYLDTVSASVGNCPNPIPAGFAVHNIPAGAVAYFAPGLDSYTGFNLPAGTWYSGAVEDGFVEVWIACEASNVFVPAANVVG